MDIASTNWAEYYDYHINLAALIPKYPNTAGWMKPPVVNELFDNRLVLLSELYHLVSLVLTINRIPEKKHM